MKKWWDWLEPWLNTPNHFPLKLQGNRSSSSACGSADVLEELGVAIELDPEVCEQGRNWFYDVSCIPSCNANC
ncbi:hypothetical protein L1987_53599 [Smallanthus sonchifolius]|uniref:Uncharacterized protein n=1 Tax=Smallanthus sonchifolius TaxID=185202 RepID=A0ACB9EVT1_9ASTR|nr:hypothetical protein L1987_53599 [Smallanthus sonchifolius]